jgi:ribosome modulation factor
MPAGGPEDVGLAAREAGKAGDPQAMLDPLGMGMDAYRSNQPRSECPFDPDSEAGQRWLEGWDQQKGVEGSHPTD